MVSPRYAALLREWLSVFTMFRGLFFLTDNILFSQGHVLNALGLRTVGIREYNEMLLLVIAHGQQGERWESPRVVAACRERAWLKSGYL